MMNKLPLICAWAGAVLIVVTLVDRFTHTLTQFSPPGLIGFTQSVLLLGIAFGVAQTTCEKK